MLHSDAGTYLLALLVVVFKSSALLVIAGIGGPPAAFASERGERDHFSLHGEIKNETSLRYVKPVSFTKMLNLLRLEARYFPTPSFQVTALIRTFYDAVYDFQSVDSVAPRKNPRTILSEDLSGEELEALQVTNLREVEVETKDLELREFYADIAFDQADFRLGRQIVRWGCSKGRG